MNMADSSEPPTKKARRAEAEVRVCPYLDTINRHRLDFDFEKLCSVSLVNLNVYGCLVCGQYFQGRGKTSHAYFHSLQEGHHVFINLHTRKIYCLPDNYEVIDSSLADIQYVLHPTFSREEITNIDISASKFSRGLDGAEYLAGFVGLNNLKKTDFVNVVIQCLTHITPLRSYFLAHENYEKNTSPLVQAFGELTRKIWNPRNFKGHVSPHELLVAVSNASKKRYRIGTQSDPLEFLSWLLGALHRDLGGSKKGGDSIIHEIFQGEVRIDTAPGQEAGNSGDGKTEGADEWKTARSQFMFLSLDIPTQPLFKDSLERNIIPQAPLYSLLKKFDGKTEQLTLQGDRKKYRLTRLPEYLIVHVKRFHKNNFFLEKNPTIITFPVKNLDLSDFVENAAQFPSTKYDLIGNVCHDGKPEDGSYRCFVMNQATDQWYEMDDLMVRDAIPQLLTLSETYMQVYKRAKPQ